MDVHGSQLTRTRTEQDDLDQRLVRLSRRRKEPWLLSLTSRNRLSNLVAQHIRRSVSLSLTAAGLFAVTALVPTGAWAHSRHHHSHRSQAKATHAAKYGSPIDVAGAYAHNAGIFLAGSVNRTRSMMAKASANADPDFDTKYADNAAGRLAADVNRTRAAVAKHSSTHAMTPHQIRLQRHEERLAMRAEHLQIHGRRVAMQNEAMASGNVVAAAYSFRGTRYVFGGTSRSGFDCSSFVRFILGRTDGVELPRTAEEQYYHGQPVAREDLRPGDLVFFKNTYKHGISHVGIYTGDGKFVHAANSHKGVREDSLDEPYYAHHYAGARRVIGMR